MLAGDGRGAAHAAATSLGIDAVIAMPETDKSRIAVYGGSFGDGTVFKVTTSGTETLLHSFLGSPKDGARPLCTLAYLKGTLYGTTYYGGSQNQGAIFKTTTSGKTSLLYSFLGGSNGAFPYAGMIYAKPSFYGTTETPGTVFSLTL